MESLSCPSCAATLIIENGKLTLTYQTEAIVAAEQAKLDATASAGNAQELTASDTVVEGSAPVEEKKIEDSVASSNGSQATATDAPAA